MRIDNGFERGVHLRQHLGLCLHISDVRDTTIQSLLKGLELVAQLAELQRHAKPLAAALTSLIFWRWPAASASLFRLTTQGDTLRR